VIASAAVPKRRTPADRLRLSNCSPSSRRSNPKNAGHDPISTRIDLARGEVSADDGATWRLAVEFLARRVDPA